MKSRVLSTYCLLVFVIVYLLTASGCGSGTSVSSVTDNPAATEDPAQESDIIFSSLDDISDWTEETHEKLDLPELIANLDVVFDKSKVQKMRIVIDYDNWILMNKNLADLTSELGNSRDFNSVDSPFFVPSDVFYLTPSGDWKKWYRVGVRFKGNSSLYNANCSKLPFKLDFDEFEDEYPAIKNQRFYGFKQLNLKNNYGDQSEMHEIVANELFTDFGLVGANSSFYELYLNVDGSKNTANDIYYGLYTLVEEIDDTVIKTQYGDDEGNIYKPEDDAATFAAGTYNEAEYDWKNYDDDIQDKYADIEALYNLINDSSRTTSPAVWKSNLEAIFNVNIFLKWLAANNVMQNWDTYGVMSHNYYLYNNPATGLFDWIQWDNNEALTFNPRCLPLNLSTVTFDWPLIRYILDIDEYEATYKTEVVNFSNSYFNGASSTRFSVNDRYEGDEREF
jgi:uncharacterized protein YceK